MNEPNYRFFYVRSEPTQAALDAFALVPHQPHKTRPKGFPVACVAYALDTAIPKREIVKFALSTFNPNDDYSRDIAKGLAVYRFMQGKTYTVPREKTGLATKKRIMEILAVPLNTPFRVQKAALHWLSQNAERTADTAVVATPPHSQSAGRRPTASRAKRAAKQK